MSSSNVEQTPTKTLYLGDLSTVATTGCIARVIVAHGVHGFQVKLRYENGMRLHYGFVEFSSIASCQRAYERLKNGFMIHGRHVRVRYGGLGLVDVSPCTSFSPTVHSVFVRFCTIAEMFGDDSLRFHFGKFGVIAAVCIMEANKVMYHC